MTKRFQVTMPYEDYVSLAERVVKQQLNPDIVSKLIRDLLDTSIIDAYLVGVNLPKKTTKEEFRKQLIYALDNPKDSDIEVLHFIVFMLTHIFMYHTAVGGFYSACTDLFSIIEHVDHLTVISGIISGVEQAVKCMEKEITFDLVVRTQDIIDRNRKIIGDGKITDKDMDKFLRTVLIVKKAES